MTNRDTGPTPPFDELGATGLERHAGRVDEEFLRELKGETGVRTYREMSDNDGIIGAILFATQMVIRSVQWETVPAGRSPADAEAADFLASNMVDMSNSWPEFVSEVMSMLTFGWSWHEIVWKRRQGPDGEHPSMFDDGAVGIRKLPIRAQESLDEWVFDDDGGIAALRQRPAPDYDRLTIPIDKSLLFRTTAAKGNPEGRSALRNAYRPWYFKRALQEIEAIGVERDLAGLPYAGIPARFFKQSATADEKSALTNWINTMRDIRVDSLQGLVYPLEYDENGNELYKVGLMSTGGQRAIDVQSAITRYDTEIASVVLADFILLGHQKVGSFALASQKSDLFSVAVEGWLEAIAEVLNRHLVPKLFRFNPSLGSRVDALPMFQPSGLAVVDLKELGEYITSLAGVGYDLFPNNALETALLQAADLPQRTEDEEAAIAETEMDDIDEPDPFPEEDEP